jgi:hypothetical protein
LLFVVGAVAQTNTSSDAEIQGRKLAQQLCDTMPQENLTNAGTLQIRNESGDRFELPLKCEVIVTGTNWLSRYTARFGTNTTDITTLVVTHSATESSRYLLFEDEKTSRVSGSPGINIAMGLGGNRLMIPFAGSDFWLCDLGLEFFHWPEQKVLPKTTNLKRGRAYTLLESTNPNPSTNGYSRVLSWIDKETGGILEAEAYDVNGKLLKDFAPKSFKKVNGQWELQEMEIRNVQTGSSTKLEFDLKK